MMSSFVLLILGCVNLCHASLGPAIIGTFAGTGANSALGNGGPATSATVKYPYGIYEDTNGVIYFADGGDYTVRSVSASGIINGFAGVPGTWSSYGNGGPATSAAFGELYNVFVNTLGLVYIADRSFGVVRRVSTSGIISAFAGNEFAGDNGNGIKATSAAIEGCAGLWGDSMGVIFVTGSKYGTVRSIDTNNIITLIAGVLSYPGSLSGNGGHATSATFNFPNYLFGTTTGVLYVTDRYNNEVRAISPSGIVTNFLGLDVGASGTSASGGAATATVIGSPIGVFVSTAGDVYAVDAGYSVVRKVTANTGIVDTFAGKLQQKATAPSAGDGGSPTAAVLKIPFGIFGNTMSEIFITDYDLHQIRVVTQLDPAMLPTPVPSVYPSMHPSAEPTFLPSVTPSITPSTVLPTAIPTRLTSSPSRMPSKRPIRGGATNSPTVAVTVVPTAAPTNGYVVISFNTSLSLHNVSASVLDLTSQTAVVVSVATTLNMSLNGVKFVSQLLIEEEARRLSEGISTYQVLVETIVVASSRDFPDAINRNGLYLYQKLSSALFASVQTDEFVTTLRSTSAVLHASDTRYVNVASVTVSDYEVVAHNFEVDEDSGDSKDKHDLTEGEFAGIVIAILVSVVLLVGVFLLFLNFGVVRQNSSLSPGGSTSYDVVSGRTDV